MILFTIAFTLIAVLLGYYRYKMRHAEAHFPPKGHVVTVEGVKLHYIRKGSGTPVVFLHGGILSANDFESVMERVAAQGYEAISFDRPGYGYSERPKNENVTPLVQARLIHGALKELNIEKPIMVGHSWSGILVLTYALSYPDDLAGIVTLGGAMYKEGYPAENGDPIFSLITTPFMGKIMLHTLLKSPLGTGLAKYMLKETFAPESVPTRYREAALALWLRPNQFKANREDVMAFVPAAEKLSRRYYEIKHPVVIVVGENDPFGTREQAYRLQRDISHAKLIVLPNVAHMIPQNHPHVVMDAINKLMLQENSRLTHH